MNSSGGSSYLEMASSDRDLGVLRVFRIGTSDLRSRRVRARNFDFDWG